MCSGFSKAAWEQQTGFLKLLGSCSWLFLTHLGNLQLFKIPSGCRKTGKTSSRRLQKSQLQLPSGFRKPVSSSTAALKNPFAAHQRLWKNPFSAPQQLYSCYVLSQYVLQPIHFAADIFGTDMFCCRYVVQPIRFAVDIFYCQYVLPTIRFATNTFCHRYVLPPVYFVHLLYHAKVKSLSVLKIRNSFIFQ